MARGDDNTGVLQQYGDTISDMSTAVIQGPPHPKPLVFWQEKNSDTVHMKTDPFQGFVLFKANAIQYR